MARAGLFEPPLIPLPSRVFFVRERHRHDLDHWQVTWEWGWYSRTVPDSSLWRAHLKAAVGIVLFRLTGRL